MLLKIVLLMSECSCSQPFGKFIRNFFFYIQETILNVKRNVQGVIV